MSTITEVTTKHEVDLSDWNPACQEHRNIVAGLGVKFEDEPSGQPGLVVEILNPTKTGITFRTVIKKTS